MATTKLYTTTTYAVHINKAGTIFPQYSNDGGQTWSSWKSAKTSVTRRSVDSAKSFIMQKTKRFGIEESSIAIRDARAEVAQPKPIDPRIAELAELREQYKDKGLTLAECYSLRCQISTLFTRLYQDGVEDLD